MQNGLIDLNSRTDVGFGVKIATFWNPWPQNRQNVPNFGRDRKFLLDFAFNIGVSGRVYFTPCSGVNTPYSLSEPNKNVIVNMQCWGGKLKYVPEFWIGGYRSRDMTDIAYAQWRNDMHWTVTLEPNISKTLRDRARFQWSTYSKSYMGYQNQIITCPMTSRDPKRSRSWPTVWVKKSPLGLVAIFLKRLGIFKPNFTCLLCVPIYARLRIFIQPAPCNFDEVMPY